MLNIYFTASTTNNGELIKNYRHIILNLKKTRSKILSGEQIINQQLLNKDRSQSTKEIFKREKKLIDQADLVVTEVTKPSTGVGGQIVYALIKKKPVLGLVYKGNEDKLSPMIAGNPSDNLFLEHYDFDNLDLILKNFLTHIKKLKRKKGKLIVIDGPDGSGKTTQAKLLVDYLKKKKILVKYLDFPRYYTSFHGETVAKFLRGEFGSLNEISPYLASLAFALDRVSAKEEMEEFINKGGIIVANRYVSSNMAHQGAKFKTDEERDKFSKWLEELEYKVHKIPKEDLVLYLYVSWQISLYLTKNKPVRRYLKGEKADIHEKDIHYRQVVEKMYLQLSQKNKHWVKINCVENNKILPPRVIHKKIIEILKF